jgi:3'-phosphoadenosine 5'-phosphosulfate sulfotransferase (PAPS reductase)/FAD synthetase
MTANRTVVWFSCGAASAVAAKIAVESRQPVEVVYCDTSASEHPDNARFLADVERWIGQSVTVIKSDKYRSVDEVIEKRRYMSGIAGALCTVELKKIPRFGFQRPDDVHVFGLTFDETERIVRFTENNHDLSLWWPLVEQELTKQDCLRRITRAGIALPVLYQQGYRNNNCIGCVKASSADYWNKIRADYPDVFAKRAAQERELGVTLAKWKGQRVYLDELPNKRVTRVKENVSCGPECGLPFEDLTHA